MANRRVSLGKPIRLSDRQLDQVSKVTAVDIAKAQELWRNSAPPEFEELLDAETVADDEETESRFPTEAALLALAFVWNEQAGAYVDTSTGDFVPIITARDALELVMGSAKTRMNGLTQQLIDGTVPLAEWQAGMMEQIKLSHTAAAAASRGGWAQMSQADWGAAGRMIRTQYDYLRGFSSQIASGEQGLNGQALVRSDLYGNAARGTFEEMRRRYETMQNGMEEERRILGEADHCNGCLEQAALGWQPIGTLEPIGGMECLTRCHCKFIYRKVGPDREWVESDE